MFAFSFGFVIVFTKGINDTIPMARSYMYE